MTKDSAATNTEFDDCVEVLYPDSLPHQDVADHSRIALALLEKFGSIGGARDEEAQTWRREWHAVE